MRHLFHPRWAAFLLLFVASLLVPAHDSVSAAGRASGPALLDNTRDFDTTLLGTTKDRKHKIQLNVAREPGDSLVQLTITLLGVGSTSTTGSSYTFTVPPTDLTVGAAGAKLDTHTHLGTYGHITAQWKYTSSPTPITDNDNPCNPPTNASYTQVTALVSAALNLTFPCDGVVTANVEATGVTVDTGQVPIATNSAPGTPPNFYQSIYFSADLAEKTAAAKQIVVGSYQFGAGSPLLVVGIAGPATAAIGLSQSVHFATDTLPAGALTTAGRGSTLHYSGTLGTVDLTFTRKGQPFSLQRPAKCIVPNASAQDQSKMLTISTFQATVAGTANLTMCVALKVTFGGSDMATHLATSAPTPPTIGGGGTGGTFGSGAIQIKKVSPPDGSTGVSTSPVISATLSAAPGPGQVNFVLTGADNPMLVAALPPPTYNAASMTESSTPMMPLQPNTRYKLMVVVVTGSGLSTSVTTFTTGS
jgi:hypothetical protein